MYLIIGQPGSISMERSAVKILKKYKIDYFRTSFEVSKNSILKDIVGLFQIIKLCNKIKPNVIHSASPKANLLTGITSFFIKAKEL